MLRQKHTVAGRDGKISRCTMILSVEEVFVKRQQSVARLPSLRSIKFAIEEFFKGNLKWSDARCLQLHDISFRLHFRVTYLVSLFRLTVEMGYLKDIGRRPSMMICQVQSGSREALDLQPLERNLLDYLSRQGPTSTVDLISAAELLGEEDVFKVHGALLKLSAKELVNCTPETQCWSNLVQLERNPPSAAEVETIARTYYAQITKLQGIREASHRDFLEISTSGRCMTAVMAEKLGGQLPGGKCGRCSVCCLGRGFTVPTPPRHVPTYDHVAAILQDFPEFHRDPRLLVRIALGIIPIPSKRNSSVVSKANWKYPHFGSMQMCSFEVSVQPLLRSLNVFLIHCASRTS